MTSQLQSEKLPPESYHYFESRNNILDRMKDQDVYNQQIPKFTLLLLKLLMLSKEG